MKRTDSFLRRVALASAFAVAAAAAALWASSGGQLSNTTSVVEATAANQHPVTVYLFNTNAAAETVTVQIVPNSGTSRSIASFTLQAGESATLYGIPLGPSDSVNASATDAAQVNYFVMSLPTTYSGPTGLAVYDATGALKQSQVSVGSLAQAITATNANALAVGQGGATNPAFNVDSVTAASVTGLNVKSAASGGGVAVKAISSAGAEGLTLDAKSTGTITVGGTSTGRVQLGAIGQPSFRPGNAVRCTTQADYTTNTTLGNVTGLSVTLEAGRKYAVRAKLFTTSTANGGVKVGFGGTATATATVAEAKVWSTTTLNTSTQVTALGQIASALVASDSIVVEAGIVVNTGGTLTIQAAQNTSHADTTSVKVGSSLVIEDVGS